jgi:hypothetical protein
MDYAHQIGFKNFRFSSYAARHCWTNSKAYQLGLHPDKSQPELSWTEKIGFWYQRFMTRLGANKGSEVIVVLEKS